MAKKPYRISTHEAYRTPRPPTLLCTAAPESGCCRATPAYAVVERGHGWDGEATCEQHAGRQLWAALVKANEAA